MFAKAPMATHIVSQVCFDAEVICGWIRAVRQRGTRPADLDRRSGLRPRAKLLRLSMKMGLGESARYLRHNRGWLSRLLGRRFTPADLVRGLAPAPPTRPPASPASTSTPSTRSRARSAGGGACWSACGLVRLQRLRQQRRQVHHAQLVPARAARRRRASPCRTGRPPPASRRRSRPPRARVPR